MEKRYKLLRLIATLWKVLAWLVLIVGLLGSVGALLMALVGGMGQTMGQMTGFNVAGPLIGLLMMLSGAIVSIFYFAMLYTFGEVLMVLIQIEENTRRGGQRPPAPLQPATPTYNPTVMETPPPPYTQ